MLEGGAASGAAAETGADGVIQRHALLSGGRKTIRRVGEGEVMKGYGGGKGRNSREKWGGGYRGRWTEEI